MPEDPSDTPPEIDWRTMTSRQRIQRMLALTQQSRDRVRAELRERYPEASEEELKIRFAQQTLGMELTKAAFGRTYED